MNELVKEIDRLIESVDSIELLPSLLEDEKENELKSSSKLSEL